MSGAVAAIKAFKEVVLGCIDDSMFDMAIIVRATPCIRRGLTCAQAPRWAWFSTATSFLLLSSQNALLKQSLTAKGSPLARIRVRVQQVPRNDRVSALTALDRQAEALLAECTDADQRHFAGPIVIMSSAAFTGSASMDISSTVTLLTRGDTSKRGNCLRFATEGYVLPLQLALDVSSVIAQQLQHCPGARVQSAAWHYHERLSDLSAVTSSSTI